MVFYPNIGGRSPVTSVSIMWGLEFLFGSLHSPLLPRATLLEFCWLLVDLGISVL